MKSPYRSDLHIKNTPVSLLSFPIQPEEDITGYVAGKALNSGVGSKPNLVTGLGNAQARVPWVHPTRLKELCDSFPHDLPDVHRVMIKHTRYRLNAAFLTKKQAKSLYNSHAENGSNLTGVSRPKSWTRGRLTFCTKCVADDYAKFGYTFWRRAHLMPGISVCDEHSQVLVTFCNNCESGHRRNPKMWSPALTCICGSELKKIFEPCEKEMQVALMVSKMASELLKDLVPYELSERTIPEAIRGKFGNHPRTTLIGYVKKTMANVLGTRGTAFYEIGDATIHRFLNPTRLEGGVRNPVQSLVIVSTLFGSWSALINAQMNANSSSEIEIAPTELTRTNKRKKNRTIKGARYAANLHALAPKDKKHLISKFRSWLCHQMEMNPLLNRTKMIKLPGGHRAHIHFSAIDKPWFNEKLPPNSNRQASSNVCLRAQNLVKHIYDRHAALISACPERRIYRLTLLNNSKCESIKAPIHSETSVLNALEKCIDTFATWSERVIEVVCRDVRMRCQSSLYGAKSTYRLTSDKEISHQINKARKWIRQFDTTRGNVTTFHSHPHILSRPTKMD